MPSTLAAKLHRGTWIEEEERTKAEQKRRARTLPIIVPLLAHWAERLLLPWHVACGGRLCCAAQHTVFIQATLPWTEPMRRRDFIVYESKSGVVGSFACGNHWRSARALRGFSAYWEHDGRRFGGRRCKYLNGIWRYFRPGRNKASAAPVRS